MKLFYLGWALGRMRLFNLISELRNCNNLMGKIFLKIDDVANHKK